MLSLARWQTKNDNRLTAFDGRLYLERRPALSPNWYCRCCHKNKQHYKTTKSPHVLAAQDFAERWFLDLQSRIQKGEPVCERTLATTYRAFINHHENDLLKAGSSNPLKIQRYRYTWNNVEPFLGAVRLSDITFKKLEAFRVWRQKESVRPLTEKTLHADFTLVSLVLKYAAAQDWITHLPEFPVEHIKHESPDWFSLPEWKQLIEKSLERIGAADSCGNAAERIRRQRRELHAFLLLMAHGCIRVDECLALRWRDLQPDKRNRDLPVFEHTVLIHVRKGKTGARQAIGTWGALTAMGILDDLHENHKSNDKLFNSPHRHGMARLLDAANLRLDAKGRKRNAKTLRHTALMFRFMYQPEIRPHELAAISGTSAATLEKYYLRHVTGQMVQDRLMKKAVAEVEAIYRAAAASGEPGPRVSPSGELRITKNTDPLSATKEATEQMTPEQLAALADLMNVPMVTRSTHVPPPHRRPRRTAGGSAGS